MLCISSMVNLLLTATRFLVSIIEYRVKHVTDSDIISFIFSVGQSNIHSPLIKCQC